MLALFWTQSRGPTLGFLLGAYLFGLLLFAALRPPAYRIWTVGWLGGGLVGISFLVLLATPGVATVVRAIPSLARLGSLDLEANTAQVRLLIWQGAADMLTAADPLTYPDGSSDRIHPLRPLLGYGPETMWLAFNPFYPPELAHHTDRDSSPDRAHNETWDALVSTGLLGFIAHVLLYGSLFYWTLRWLGLIRRRRHTLLFAALLSLASLVLILSVRLLDHSWRLFGLAVPAGMISGLVAYIAIAALRVPDLPADGMHRPRRLLLIALLATLAAHFVEIHFGIAITATRTYFWIETALLLAVGMGWAKTSEVVTVSSTADETTDETTASTEAGHKRGPLLSPTAGTDLLIFLTFVFIYTTNSAGSTGAFAILWHSISLHPTGAGWVASPAILFLMLFTWLVGATLGVAGMALSRPRRGRRLVAARLRPARGAGMGRLAGVRLGACGTPGARRSRHQPGQRVRRHHRPLYPLHLDGAWLVAGGRHPLCLAPAAPSPARIRARAGGRQRDGGAARRPGFPVHGQRQHGTHPRRHALQARPAVRTAGGVDRQHRPVPPRPAQPSTPGAIHVGLGPCPGAASADGPRPRQLPLRPRSDVRRGDGTAVAGNGPDGVVRPAARRRSRPAPRPTGQSPGPRSHRQPGAVVQFLGCAQ